MLSDRPAMPGRSAQMPRTHRSTRTPACPLPFGLLVNPAYDAGPQRFRCDQEPVVGPRTAVPGQVVEQGGDVLAHRGISGEQTEILIEPGRGRMVVPPPEMAVPRQRA